jgi:uncharacterized protein (TIGR00255 family)
MMALSSMTGFARGQGVCGAYSWSWEVRSVNGKGLDIRLRWPPGWEAVDQPVRARTSAGLVRGTVHATLTIERQGVQPVVKVNDQVLAAVLSTIQELSGKVDAAAPRLDGILAIKGVVEVQDADEREDDRRAAEAAVLAGFDRALADLVQMRRHEGEVLGKLLSARLADISGLVARAEAVPGRKPEAVKKRLAEQVAQLLENSARFDADRLHQEAIMLATRADVREELDRLTAHVDQATKLITGGGSIGRRLDFLAQELNREANTLCAKSNDVELTNIGLELKNTVEQFREQVQNLE